MTTAITTRQALSHIKKLSGAERVLIVQQIWDSVAEDAVFLESPEVTAEVKRRIAKRATGKGSSRPWRAVIRSLEARPVSLKPHPSTVVQELFV